MKTSYHNVVDLFCGTGGLSLGFNKTGFNCIFALDNDPKAIETYKNNLGNHAVCDDIYGLTAQKILDFHGQATSIDVIVGGPPCQGFSVQRRGDDIDSRNLLVLEFLRIVIEAKPKLFLMENVGGLLSKRGAPILEEFTKKLSKAGYKIKIKKLDSSEFGVPQRRKRVFLVGCSYKRDFIFPEGMLDFINKPKTVRESIEDLINLSEEDVSNHKADKLSPKNLERIKSITQGQGRDSLPAHLQLPCHLKNSTHRHLDTYGRMAWDLPAPTITARFDSFSRGRFGHPTLNRTITLREGARLQTFPDDFVFCGTKVEVARQIGNAVPPLLAEELAKAVKRHLDEGE